MTIEIPLMYQADLLIFGAGSSAVAAAVAAREKGLRVVIASASTYPGEDICATMNYWGWGRSGATPGLAPELFMPRTSTEGRLPSPMQVKRSIERAMLEAGVDFLYMTYPVAVLRDERGAVAGAVVANRSGFQAIRAAAIVDASPRAAFARGLSEARFRPFASGIRRCRRAAAGNDTADVARVPGVRAPGYFAAQGRDLIPYQWRLDLAFSDASPAAAARAEVAGRLATWYPGQLLAAERLDTAFDDRLVSVGSRQERWKGADGFDLGALRVGQTSVFVLGSLADVSDEVADLLLDPCAATAIGRRLGRELTQNAAGAVAAGRLTVDTGASPAVEGLDVRRDDRYFRLKGRDAVSFDLNRLPVFGSYDVAVAGGGTGGAPAGIAAGRAGANAVIFEYTPSLGGIGTEGRIASYYHGNRCGFTREIDLGVHALGRAPEFSPDSGFWNTEWKKHWYLRACDMAGTEVWFGSLTVAAALEGRSVRGLVVATANGVGLVRAKCVVDSTGNADVAAAAGGRTVAISKAHVAVQGTGLAPVEPGRNYTNTDYTFVDDSDVVDVTRAFAVARGKFDTAFDMSQIVDSRQRQQVEGELSLDPLDFLAKRTFPDTVVTASSNFDSHGFTIHPVFMAKPPDREELRAHIPFRCLIPKGLDGILVTGLGVSSHRDALPVIRMQPDVQNQGYAAGRAAAMAAASGSPVREIDIKALQRHLIDIKVLEQAVLDHVDSFPISDATMTAAVANGTDDYLGLSVIFSDPARSVPLLKAAYAAAEGSARLRYAHLLGLLGDPAGVELLAETVDRSDWDQGWNYRGMGQFGFSLSRLDSLLIALGRTRSPVAVPVMLRKLASLRSDQEFSHLRAATLAFEAHPTPKAAPEFARLLDGVAGQSKADVRQMVTGSSKNPCDNDERNVELKELLLARGLLVCGDYMNRARETLETYSHDLHGHYARHARALLESA